MQVLLLKEARSRREPRSSGLMFSRLPVFSSFSPFPTRSTCTTFLDSDSVSTLSLVCDHERHKGFSAGSCRRRYDKSTQGRGKAFGRRPRRRQGSPSQKHHRLQGKSPSQRLSICLCTLVDLSYHSGSLWSSQFSPAPFSSPSTTLLSQTCSPMLSKLLAISPCCPGLVSALPSAASLSSLGVKLTAYSMSNGSSCKSYRFKPALSRLHLEAT